MSRGSIGSARPSAPLGGMASGSQKATRARTMMIVPSERRVCSRPSLTKANAVTAAPNWSGPPKVRGPPIHGEICTSVWTLWVYALAAHTAELMASARHMALGQGCAEVHAGQDHLAGGTGVGRDGRRDAGPVVPGGHGGEPLVGVVPVDLLSLGPG